MRTVRSSTEPGPVAEWRSAITDTGHLLRFRFGSVRGRSRRLVLWLSPIPLVITLAALVVPALAPGAGDDTGRARDLLILLPAAAAAFLVLTILSAVSTGGGRELLSRDHAVAYPVSVLTDHLGALLLAPLNIAWLVQGWTILAMTSYAAGPGALLPSATLMLLFLAAATAGGQVVGWLVETLRRGPFGLALHRMLVLATLGTGVWIVTAGHTIAVLEASPTVDLAVAIGRLQTGDAGAMAVALPLLAVLTVVLVIGGVWPARLALARMPRDEARIESGTYRARRNPASDLVVLFRTDLASVLRSVPLRRGLMTLALLPGLVALAGDVQWQMLVLLPGLVASGVTLLFGVNAWCLDGRGALWRESLPVDPGRVFLARTLVLSALLLGGSAVTLLLASLRAGVPTGSELTALVCAWLVVCVQVVAASMTWSMRSPYAVDLRSARATPAPPVVMVGYSARLAMATTFVGLLFSAGAATPYALLAPVVALPVLAWSLVRLARARRRWLEPECRSLVAVTVAA